MGYSLRLATRDILYAESHRQDSTSHGFCYTSRGAMAGTRIFAQIIVVFCCLCITASTNLGSNIQEGRKEMFYLTTHSTHFIYCYMASDLWLMTILIVREETSCRHIGYSLRLTARVLLYAPSHRQDSTYHGLCYTSGGALAGTRNSSMDAPHEGSIRRPIAP